MSPFETRLAAVRRGSRALDAELAGWCNRAQDEELWHRHQSQLQRLAADIGALLGAACASLKQIAEDQGGWAMLGRAERGLLAANRIWDYFRSKYMLRLHPDLGQILRLADDFVWACYRPVQVACTASVKREPPLVHFSEVWSPYAMARDRSFANELRFAESATADSLLDEAFEEVLSRLPVPLVSMPWFQANHIPSLAILAHECGHIVSWDFGLGNQLEEQIASREWKGGAENWQAWREELFADLFGVIVASDGFVSTLIALLACDGSQIGNEVIKQGPYPPRSLRIEIVLRALHRRDQTLAAALRAGWEAAYPVCSAFPAHEADAEQFIDLVFGLQCGASRLDGLFALDERHITNELKLRAVLKRALDLQNFDAIGAVVLAVRIDVGRMPDVTKPEDALATIGQWVDQRKTGYRSSKGEANASWAASEIDANALLAIWEEI